MSGSATTRKNRRRFIWVVLFGAAAYSVFLFLQSFAVIPRSVTTKFPGGAWARMHSGSLIKDNSTCEIEISTKGAKSSTVVLGQDWFDVPMLIIPSTNESVFYCVYDYDIDFQLLKFDLSQPFHALPSNNPMSAAVISATCGVERVRKVDGEDWRLVGTALQQMPSHEYKRQVLRGLDLIFFRVTTGQKFLSDSILHNFGGQGQYSGEPF